MLLCTRREKLSEAEQVEKLGLFTDSWNLFDLGKKRAPEVFKDTLLLLYDEGIFPKDSFVRRAQLATSRKELPKETEWLNRGLEMLLALQERSLVAKAQSDDLLDDERKFFKAWALFTLRREEEIVTQQNESRYLLEQLRTAQCELESLVLRVHSELGMQEKIDVDWRAEGQMLSWDCAKMSREKARLESQQKADRKNCAGFMAGMLAKNRQLVHLAEVVPQYHALQTEMANLEGENDKLVEILERLNAEAALRLPQQAALVNEMVSRERKLEELVAKGLKLHEEVVESANRRVEDVLPYWKVMNRPGGYGTALGFFPGEPKPSKPTGEDLFQENRSRIDAGVAEFMDS